MISLNSQTLTIRTLRTLLLLFVSFCSMSSKAPGKASSALKKLSKIVAKQKAAANKPYVVPEKAPVSNNTHHVALTVPGLRHLAIKKGIISTNVANAIAARNNQPLHEDEPHPTDTGTFDATQPATWVDSDVTRNETVEIPISTEPAFSAAADILAVASQVIPSNRQADVLYLVQVSNNACFNHVLLSKTVIITHSDC